MTSSCVRPRSGPSVVARKAFTVLLLATAASFTSAQSIPEILDILYSATNGDSWSNNGGWRDDTTNSYCNWAGITCYPVNRYHELYNQIETLDLSNNKLNGDLPKDVFRIPFLSNLILRDNPDLNVRFDDMQYATMLNKLVISNTVIESFDNLNGPELREFHITGCSLTMPFPMEILNLKKLEALYANYNYFYGFLPDEIGTMVNLVELFLLENNFEGPIPDSIGNLVNLEILVLSNNAFAGPVPSDALNQLVNLKVLSLADNLLVENIPSLSALRSIEELYLDDNLFTGQIPSNFLSSAPKDQVMIIDLSNNSLEGTFGAARLKDFYSVSLDITGNQFTSIDSNLCQKTEWMSGAVGDYGCDAIVCPVGSWAPTGRRTPEFSCVSGCQSATFMGADNCDGDKIRILKEFYLALHGDYWEANNWFGSDNECEWTGITCNDDTEKNIIAIRLSDRKLSGTVPSSIFSFDGLETIDLSNNFITFKFDGIRNLKNLQVLDLTSTGLDSLDNIDQLRQTSISELYMSSNNIESVIPAAIYQLTNLRILKISNNKLSGNLSSNIGRLTMLEELHLFGNNLTGSIPEEIGNLKNTLRVATLSENDFTGMIPYSLNFMSNLVNLSIHQKTNTKGGLTGSVPHFSGSPKLAYLNLSGNSLSGFLPSNFLANSERLGKEIVVDLSSNKIQGQIPSSWDMFGYLNINLANNMIEHIHSSLCTMKGWQNGALGALDGCDPILCKAGSFNANGRATPSSGCVPCPSAQYFGTTKCDDLGADEVWWILETFYASTNGESWSGGEGWLQSPDPCDGTWTGIICDKEKVNILEIDLAESGLTGTPDDMIFNLPRLQTLNLSYNDINFSFDGIGAAHDLRVLKLSETQLNSIAGIGQAVSLNELHLTGNNLSGKIPDELFNLINLRGLYMNYNRFTGRLSSKIGQLVNLENLFLLGNDLTGQIPASIGELKQMKVLTLSENYFVGTIPESINQMVNLEIFAVQGKSMNAIPSPKRRKLQYQSRRTQLVTGLTGTIPSFNGLKNLEGLYLAFNSLSGKIPYDFLSGVQDKTKTITVDLEGNYLAGMVPASLTQFDDLNLSISSNRFSDIAPGLCKMTNWLQGGIGAFSCDGLLCPKNTFSETGRRTEDQVCEPCPENTVAPFMGSVQCVTANELEFENERSVLKLFYDSLDGAGWYSKNNWYDDTVTFCDWHGITCTSDGKSVQAIHLASNGLKGTLPDVVFDLPNLQELNLSSNEVSINFDYIGSARKLEYLNVDDNGIDSLNGIQSASALRFLHASNNAFTKFPAEIVSLSNLQVLYLSFNKFESTIPNLSVLSQLSFFACKRCGFHGTLPSWLGSLKQLKYLSLAGNKLTGQIPTSLTQTPSLIHLDVSDQAPRGGGLTGSVPSFSTLGSLSELFLQKNKLTGVLSDDFLANTTASSVTVDLRTNSITGSVPRSLLGAVGDFTLLLAGNQINEIPDAICNTPPDNWNQGDLLEYGCDGLLCKKGFYSPIGRETAGYQCQVCSDSEDSNVQNYLGNTRCGTNPTVQALNVFYYTLSGPDWINNQGWTENDAYCTWYGIECDAAGELVGIDLSANNLVGKVPKDIYQVTSLTYIILRENAITMEFNGIEKLTLLESLNLSSTGMNSISGIGAALSLKELHFTSNELTSIPNELFNLVNLERLLMNFNKIQGTLSSRIGQLKSLRELYLFRNKLTGNLPSELANLKNIRVLGLGENDFSGEIPEGISDLQNVEVIALQHVSGNGAVAGAPIVGSSELGLSGKVPAFDNNPKLRELYISFNNLSGAIPNSFLRAIDSKFDDVIVDLAGNAITGSIPSSLNQFTSLNLYLAGNQITTISDSSCSNLGWMNGRVESTGCDAILCPIGFYNEFGRQTADDNPCEPCPFTFTASYYGSTSCTPDSTDYNEMQILTKFYHATGGSKWLDADNWLSNKVSICDWHGVFCESQTSQGMVVTEIHLPSNRLQGTVPPQIFNLRHLRMFNVRDNKVDVQLYAMREGPALEELYLDYTNLSSLKGIGRATNLKTLHVQQNNLRGEHIPDELFTLTGLKHLYISDANLSGPLSSKIGNLKQLEELYCHGNDLSGEIPESIGDLLNLEVLILSENLLVGPLPDTVSKLTKLESLFIDSFTRRSAGLSGPLPSFEGMPVLRQLYLNSNSFTGTIPESFLSNQELIRNDKLSPQAIAASARRKQRINVGLKGNRLEGSIPAALAKFQRLSIDLSDNLITSIDEELCIIDPWMGGDVGNYGCNAILCPPGYYNLYGRQTNALSPCKPCEGAEQSQYFGATQCLSQIKQKERDILELFYKTCGGDDWKNKDGWLQEGTDICNWHGISCSNGGSVDTIDLGANNVIGTPPLEIFELENLKYLWLYSNPIKFSFKGIGRARRLESLLLDSTGLESLDGIGNAYQLVDLDIRFNNLKGQIPDEISNLVNLENLSLSDNKFTGSLPSVSRMHRLKSLRAANNKFTGLLPSFEENYKLKTIDLSDNKITGSIPSSFLESVSSEETIYIDLSRNRIEGSVPGELARFEKMTIYLKDNYIFGVERDVCDNVSWNEGDVGRYSCDAIICPAGTYAPATGRQSLGGSKCVDCKLAKYYGQSQCVDLQDFYSSAFSRGIRPLLSLLVTGVALLLL